MFNVGLPEIIFIALVIFVLFGAKALPEIARGLGQGIKLFKRELYAATDNDEQTETPAVVHQDTEGMKIGLKNDFDPGLQRPDWRPKPSAGDGQNDA